MNAIERVHPARLHLGTIHFFRQRYIVVSDRRNVVALFVDKCNIICRKGSLDNIQNRCVQINAITRAREPLGQVIVRKRMRHAIVVYDVAKEREIDRDVGGLEDLDGDLRGRALVGDRELLDLVFVLVIAGDCDIGIRRIDRNGLAVAVDSGDLHAGQIKVFAKIVFRFVSTGNVQTGNDGRAEQRRVQCIFALCPVLIVTAFIQEVFDRAILKFILSLGRTHVVLICFQRSIIKAKVLGLVILFDLANQLRNVSGFFIEIVVFDMLALINGTHIANNAADIIASRCDRSIEEAVLDPAFIPALLQATLAAEQAADIILASDIAINIAVNNGYSHRVGRGLICIALCDQAADPVAGRDQIAAEMTVADLAHAHALPFCSGQTANIIYTIYIGFTIAVADLSVKTSADEGADVA